MKSRLELLRPWENPWIAARLAENLIQAVAPHPGLWASYRAFAGEANPECSAPPGVEWVYPRMVGEVLVFHRSTEFVRGPFGIQEPLADSPSVAIGQLTGALIPALAFDSQGGRLGRGRGFYDRTLAGFQGLKIGLAFEAQRLSIRLPVESWDLHMDAVVTEASVFSFGGF